MVEGFGFDMKQAMKSLIFTLFLAVFVIGCGDGETNLLVGEWQYEGSCGGWGGFCDPSADLPKTLTVDELHVDYSRYKYIFENQVFIQGSYNIEVITYDQGSYKLVVFVNDDPNMTSWLDGRYSFNIHNNKLQLSPYDCDDCGYDTYSRIGW